jgi:hypothetical protein
VSTALSWTETRRAVADVGPLLRFRTAGLRGRARKGVIVALAAMVTLTVLAGWLPSYLPQGRIPAGNVLLLLPTGYISVLVISIVSAAASGGGRELLPREQAVAYPVSPTTDHLGALMMAPLNIAWLLQSWTLLGATAYVIGPRWQLLLAELPVLLWLFAATAIAQVVAWLVEWVRRGPFGVLVVRTAVVVLAATMASLIVADQLVPLLDHSPTVKITLTVLHGAAMHWGPWLVGIAWLLGVTLLAVVVGALLAGAVGRRPPRDELHEETSSREPRDNPGSDLVALLRADRVGIWRSVPLRRGLAVLALLPGLVAFAGALDWDTLCILPGLVGSGGALLFGVNSWCLDGRGALWRDSLPVSPKLAFTSRVIVLVEVLLFATALTLVMASLRAGAPNASQLAAVVCAALVLTFQVVATSLRWSVRRPFAVDLRSSRATPAPPLVMVGYSSRLALTTTVTGLMFGVATHVAWQWSVLLALPFLLFSGYRLAGVAESWSDPQTRARVIATVAS